MTIQTISTRCQYNTAKRINESEAGLSANNNSKLTQKSTEHSIKCDICTYKHAMVVLESEYESITAGANVSSI